MTSETLLALSRIWWSIWFREWQWQWRTATVSPANLLFYNFCNPVHYCSKVINNSPLFQRNNLPCSNALAVLLDSDICSPLLLGCSKLGTNNLSSSVLLGKKSHLTEIFAAMTLSPMFLSTLWTTSHIHWVLWVTYPVLYHLSTLADTGAIGLFYCLAIGQAGTSS